jgi:trigger factor
LPSTYERLGNNKVKITITIGPDEFERGVQAAYIKNRGRINLPGFRKGKAPRKIIEAQYGKDTFYDDAANELLPELFEQALDEHLLELVARPQFEMVSADKENGAVLTAECVLKPEFKISDYDGIKYKEPETAATDEEVDAEIMKAREKNTRTVSVTDRPVEDGDVAVIDFEGFVDGVAFEGGKGADYELRIGSKSFIDNFEEQIIGKNIGEEFDVNVTFPDQYGKAELEGKDAVFKVKVNAVNFLEVPEADDEFAQEVSEFETMQEYRDDVRAIIEKNKRELAESNIEHQVVTGLIEIFDRQSPDIPEEMFEAELDNIVRDFSRRLNMQGMGMDRYLEYVGGDADGLRESMRPNAISNVKGRLALEAAARNENFTVTDEELSAELDRMAVEYRIDRAKIEKSMGKRDTEMLKKDLVVKKTVKKIVASAVAE